MPPEKDFDRDGQIGRGFGEKCDQSRDGER